MFSQGLYPDGTSPPVYPNSDGRFFFALFSLCRFCLNIGFIERPLFIGLLWALLTGDFKTPLGLAIFFELLWLDLFPAGTFIPPNNSAAVMAAMALAAIFGLATPVDALLALLLALPLGWAGSRLEQRLRNRNNQTHIRLTEPQAYGTSAELTIEKAVKGMLAKGLVINFAFFMCCLLLASALIFLVLPTWRTLSTSTISWAHIWFAASMGGVLSLRWKRAYGLLAAGILTVAMSGLIGAGQF